jgi:hypothetical protein
MISERMLRESLYLMELFILENGMMGKKKDKESKNGQMEPNM